MVSVTVSKKSEAESRASNTNLFRCLPALTGCRRDRRATMSLTRPDHLSVALNARRGAKHYLPPAANMQSVRLMCENCQTPTHAPQKTTRIGVNSLDHG